jgi:hypothetical protein
VNSICQHGRCCYSFNTREGVRHRLSENGVKRNHYQNGVRHHIQTVTVPHGRWCPNLNRSHVKNARYCHSESRCFSGGTKNLDCTEGNERLRRECHRSSQILRLPTYNVGILRMTFLRGLISLLKLGHYRAAASMLFECGEVMARSSQLKPQELAVGPFPNDAVMAPLFK